MIYTYTFVDKLFIQRLEVVSYVVHQPCYHNKMFHKSKIYITAYVLKAEYINLIKLMRWHNAIY